MKWLNGYRIKLMLTGAVIVIVISVTNAWGAYFQDDFNRPNGDIGNGWQTERNGSIEVKIVDNEVLIAGRQATDWRRSGLYRAVEDVTRISFDFKPDDNFTVHIMIWDAETSAYYIDVFTTPDGSFFYASSESESGSWPGVNPIAGSEMIPGEYNTLVLEQEDTEFTLTLNDQVIGTVTNNRLTRIGEIEIAGDSVAGTVGSLHIDNVKIGQVPIIPIIDFNGDGIVDSADMCIMIDHWGEDYSLCDIAPAPFGDGIVDVEDLKVLAEHFFEVVNDDTLVAHWPLNETEGMFASDSVGDNDAVVVGGAVWQPTSGQVDGALQLNGVDGCAITNPVLNPAAGPFSIIAWVKGGAPGQVVVSQQAISNWLAADTDGNLMTELKSSDEHAGSLISETVITDGQWHRIGLVWDGSYRTLYVDDLAVAEDIQNNLVGSDSGLYLGCGKAMEPGTYWSGLIDDVRIYNRALIP